MKILLADDHALIRAGLRSELGQLTAGIDFLEAWDVDSLWQMLSGHVDLDLALVDLAMPGMEGAHTIASLRREYPAVPIVVVSGRETGPDARAALEAGAAGFIPKSALTKVMLHAIRLVLAGGLYMPPQLMEGLDLGREKPQPTAEAVPLRGRREENARLALLSPRQREVFALLSQGLSNKMIARKLVVTEGTVKSHVATIFDVLNVHNRISAVAEARRLSGQRGDQGSTDDSEL